MLAVISLHFLRLVITLPHCLMTSKHYLKLAMTTPRCMKQTKPYYMAWKWPWSLRCIKVAIIFRILSSDFGHKLITLFDAGYTYTTMKLSWNCIRSFHPEAHYNIASLFKTGPRPPTAWSRLRRHHAEVRVDHTPHGLRFTNVSHSKVGDNLNTLKWGPVFIPGDNLNILVLDEYICKPA